MPISIRSACAHTCAQASYHRNMPGRPRHFAAIGCVLTILTAGIPAPADGPGAAAFAEMRKARAAGDLDGAIKAAGAVLKAEPNNVAYLNAIGGLYCDKAQKANVLTRFSWANKCVGTWERAVAIDPKYIDVRFSLIQYYAQAPGIAGGGVEKAREQAKAIAALDAFRGELAWANLAQLEKQIDVAERHLKRAAEIDPTGMRGPGALASFYATQKRWAEANAVFEDRLAKNANDTFAAFQLARLLQMENGDQSRATRLFDQYLAAPAVPDGPSHADAWFRKGEILAKQGRKSDAATAFGEALKLVPGHPGATRALKQLKG
jgi:tetratricopeptide (TPR) repeat protein